MSFFSKLLSKTESKEYFLTLGINENRITAAVASVSGNQITIAGMGESEFTLGENETEAADIAISTAEKSLPQQFLVEKVIFGLPTAFVDNDKILPEYLARLEKITKDLSLVSSGFIEYPQALSFYLERKEEAPPTVLLLCITRNKLTFSHVRAGKVEKNVIIVRSSSFSADFEAGLKKLTSEILPSRIILYDESESSEMEEIREELLSFPWHKHSSFLHTPRIEILPSYEVTTALVEAGATSIISKSQSQSKKLPETQEAKEEETIKKEEKKIKEEEETFGFIKDKDIAIQEVAEPEKEEIASDRISWLSAIINRLSPHRLSIFFPRLNPILLPLFILGGAVISLAVFLFISLWFYPKATVNLIVYPSVSSQQIKVTFTTDSSRASKEKNVILVKSLSDENSKEKSMPTTGRKKVGDPAKGEVVIYNKTTQSKTFPKGTVVDSNNLRFSLDDDVTIASASETGESLTFGKANTKITSVTIGPENNLSAGSNFTFKDFPSSSYYAKNLQALSGGTSREVPSVAKADQDQLLALLTEELVNETKQQLQQKLDSEERILDESIQTNIISKKFSNEQGAEAKEVGLALSLKINVLVYKESDLSILTSEDPATVPSGFTVDKRKSQVKISQTTTDKKGDVLATASISRYFLPAIEQESIKTKLTGKSFKQTADLLAQEKNIGGLEIINEQDFPFWNNRLPWRTQNILLQIVSR